MPEKESKKTKGGYRPGSGRKPGSPNKASAAREAAIRASGLTPLDYLLSVMRDEAGGLPERLDAAKAAAPYVHPKLAAVEMSGNPERPLVQKIVREIVRPADSDG